MSDAHHLSFFLFIRSHAAQPMPRYRITGGVTSAKQGGLKAVPGGSMCLLDASVDTGLELALAGQAPTPQGCLAAGRGLRTEVQRGASLYPFSSLQPNSAVLPAFCPLWIPGPVAAYSTLPPHLLWFSRLLAVIRSPMELH